MKLLLVALLFVADFSFAAEDSDFDTDLKFLANEINKNKQAALECLKALGIDFISSVDIFDMDTNGIITADEIKKSFPSFRNELQEDKIRVIYMINCIRSRARPESEVGKTKKSLLVQLAEKITADKTPNKSASKQAFNKYSAPVRNLMCKLDGSIKVDDKKEKPDNIISAAEIRQMWQKYSDGGESLGDDEYNIGKAITFLKYCDHDTFTCANGEEYWKAKCCLYTANVSSDPKNVCPEFEGCINNRCERVYEAQVGGTCTSPKMPCSSAKPCCAFGGEEYECVTHTKFTIFGKKTSDICLAVQAEEELAESKELVKLAAMITADKTPNKSASKEAFNRHHVKINTDIMRKLDVDETDNIISAAEIRKYWLDYNDWGEELGEDVYEINKAIKFLEYCDTFTCANGEEYWKAKCCLYTEEEELAGVVECKDEHSSCGEHAENCEKVNWEYMQDNCKKTCGLCSAAADKGTWTLRTEGTSCDERPQKYFNGVSKAKCQTSCQNENKEFKFAQHFDDDFCACFKTCAFNQRNKDAKVYGFGEVKKCTRCSCKSFHKPTKTYSRCSPVPTNSKCSGGYCAKCKSDGTTPMPGNYLQHAAECKNYENGSLSSETEVGKLQRLMDLLEAMEA